MSASLMRIRNRAQRLNFELRRSFFRTKRPAFEKHVADSELIHPATRIADEDKPPACAFGGRLKLEMVPGDFSHAFGVRCFACRRRRVFRLSRGR